MVIVFRDELGYQTLEIDEFGVSFICGMAHFSDVDGKDYEVSPKDIIGISMKG